MGDLLFVKSVYEKLDEREKELIGLFGEEEELLVLKVEENESFEDELELGDFLDQGVQLFEKPLGLGEGKVEVDDDENEFDHVQVLDLLLKLVDVLDSLNHVLVADGDLLLQNLLKVEVHFRGGLEVFQVGLNFEVVEFELVLEQSRHEDVILNALPLRPEVDFGRDGQELLLDDVPEDSQELLHKRAQRVEILIQDPRRDEVVPLLLLNGLEFLSSRLEVIIVNHLIDGDVL